MNKEPKIKTRAWCPNMNPKKPEELETLKELYHRIDDRLVGVGDDMKFASCNKMVITIEAREETGNED